MSLLVRFRAPDGRVGCGLQGADGVVRDLGVERIAELLQLPLAQLRERLAGGAMVDREAVDGAVLLAPVDGRTEVWASGVTYRRSQQARMEESAVADVYARVYEARRPELFLKAVAWRVVGDGDLIGIRSDSGLDVPEPELALVVNAYGEIVGSSACNDVSSRSIEGENPLYLPQAKIYAGSCALGPGIRPVWELDPADVEISVTVQRGHEASAATVFAGSTRTSSMHRTFEDLVEHLFRADHFPDGAVLSTGTGVVPDLDFTLLEGDVVQVVVQGIGTLTNRVVVGREPFSGLARGAG